ncbi:MAG: DUF1573 domain-containing protein [Phycisphaerales bacterium]
MCVVTLLAGGCEDQSSQLAAATDSKDLGDISVADGPATFRCSFMVPNLTRRQIEILDVGVTCGCTDASVDQRTIPPGEVAVLNVQGTVSGPGTSVQSIFVRFSNGDVRRFNVYYRGVSDLALRASIAAASEDSDQMVLTVRLALTWSGELPPIPLIKTPDVQSVFSNWQTIEAASPDRPGRFVGELIVTLRKEFWPPSGIDIVVQDPHEVRLAAKATIQPPRVQVE